MKFKVEMTGTTELRHNLYEFLTIMLLSDPNERLLEALANRDPKEVLDMLREDIRLARELFDSMKITEIA